MAVERRTPSPPFALSGALVLGTVLAILVIPQFGPWLSAHRFHH
jgi:hypothetical protein